MDNAKRVRSSWFEGKTAAHTTATDLWRVFLLAAQVEAVSSSEVPADCELGTPGSSCRVKPCRQGAVGQKPPYVTAFADAKADAYVMYCTNAASTRGASSRLAVVRSPDGLNVRSAYGIGRPRRLGRGRASARSCSARRAGASCMRTASLNAPP